MARDRLGVRMTDLAAAGRFRGALHIERGDSVLVDAAYGTDGAGTALAPGTAFQIASISKSFTARPFSSWPTTAGSRSTIR